MSLPPRIRNDVVRTANAASPLRCVNLWYDSPSSCASDPADADLARAGRDGSIALALLRRGATRRGRSACRSCAFVDGTRTPSGPGARRRLGLRRWARFQRSRFARRLRHMPTVRSVLPNRGSASTAICIDQSASCKSRLPAGFRSGSAQRRGWPGTSSPNRLTPRYRSH